MEGPVIRSITLFNSWFVPALSMWVSTMQQEKVRQLVGKCETKETKKVHGNWRAGVGRGMADLLILLV